MASEKAPVKVTGGGGFGFADRVAAFFLAHMLSGRFPLGSQHGKITRTEFEVRDRGWFLDDLLLTLSIGGSTSRCALSIKSNDQVTQSGFPADFVASVWEQKRQASAPAFNPVCDLLGLVTPRLAVGVKTAWNQLLKQAIETDAERLLERLEAEGQSSETQRSLFASLHCPRSVCPDGKDEVETAELVRSLRLLVWDFESEPSEDDASAVELCRSVLKGGGAGEAIALWGDLQRIAADARAAGGSYDLLGLIEKLRGQYQLKEYPDFRADWDVLAALSQEARASIKQEVGSGIRVPRHQVRAEVDNKLGSATVAALVGETGCGKSAVVAAATEQRPTAPLIWLDSSQFDHPNHTALAQALNLKHTIPHLITSSTSTHGLIVFDSLERFSVQGQRLASELIKVILESAGREWRVLVTCQTHMWEYRLREFISARVPRKQISTIEIGLPRPAEIVRAISTAAPQIAPLLHRPELQNVLCNLKVLDWIVVEESLRSSADSYTFVGESDVIDWIWDRWTGQASDKHAKAAVLIKLGERDGKSLMPSINILDFSDDHQRTLRELDREGLVRVRESRASFKHDLLGDWARLQFLLASGPNALTNVREVVTFPRWQRAVRLYAQRLLEHEGGTQRWRAAISTLQGQNPEDTLAGDSFLDALIFAGNAEALLEQVWPDLIADKGQLLRRLLKRFLHIATVPDPRSEAFLGAEDLDWLSTRLRIPFVWHWYAPLRVLARHHEEVCQISPLLAAEICELWLRTIPPEWGGRADAAGLAIHLAREVQGLRAEGVWFQDNADQKVYEALCYAAPDLPDEVFSLVLELCQRRDPSPEITARVDAYHEKRRVEVSEERKKTPPEVLKRRRALPPPISGPWNRGATRPPATDGPRARVAEPFRLAILTTGACIALARVRPSIACEVLLAVCIDEPKSAEYSEMLSGNDFGTAHWQGSHPPMYFRGPFLPFLVSAPEEAIETITRLVNYATSRWAEQFLRGAPPDLDPDHYSIQLDLPDGQVRWTGDFQVFGWYRDIMIGSHSVVSALMALEKWLYDELDQGRDVSKWISMIYARANSVAFAGILITLGIRTPILFEGPLRPLLRSSLLYEWQQHLALQDDVWRIGMVSWTRAGQRVYDQVLQWHTMPHRRVFLLDTAIQLLITRRDIREFLNETRKGWLAQLATQPNESLELLCARLDPANYSLIDLGNGRLQTEFHWPEHINARTTGRAEGAQRGSLAITFPHRCRRILNGEDQPSDPEEFWKQFQSIADWNNESEGAPLRPARISAGGIAVLLTYHRSWLTEHPEHERWCLDRLQLLAKEARDEIYSPHSISDTATEAFLGESGVVLMTETAAKWPRELAARGIMGFYYTSTRAVMRQAFRQRARLGEDFGGALNLLICWSGLRWVANHTERSHENAGAQLERTANRLLNAFLEKRLGLALIPLERIAAMSRRATERIDSRYSSSWGQRFRSDQGNDEEDREVRRPHFWLDLEVLSNGFGFLGSLSEATDAEDRSQLLQYHSAVLSLFLSTMPTIERPEQETEGTPYEFDRWVLRLTAALIAQLPSSQEARAFWQPIMDLGPTAHHWVQEFFHDWFLTGRNFSPSLEAFGVQWKEMIAYSLDAPRWTGDFGKTYRLEECCIDVMGLGLTIRIVAAEDFTPVIRSLAPSFEKWAARWLSHSRPASNFAYFLSRPAGAALLPSGIIWLNRGVQGYSQYAWQERDLDDSLVGALRACWRQHGHDVATNAELQQDFLQLLNTVCNRLNADALSLRTQVSHSFPVTGA